MRYMGGKFRQSKAIIEQLVIHKGNCYGYMEPFCGAMGVAEKALPVLAEHGFTEFHLYDISEPLINMWKAAIFNGWVPP